MKAVLIAAALGTTAVAGIAYAAQTATTPPARPMKADTDGDGAVSRAEFLARAEAAFARRDTDGNGSLTRDERRAGYRGKRHSAGPGMRLHRGMAEAGMRALAAIDTDGDRRISRAEFDAASATRFARIDANRSGSIEKTEMAAGRGAGRVDADGNGVLTRAEFDARAGQRFGRIDVNGDGYLDAADRGAARGGRAAPTPSPTPEGA